MNTAFSLQQRLDRARAAALAAAPGEALAHAQEALQLAADRAALAEARTLMVQNLFATGRFQEACLQGERAAEDWLALGRPEAACEVTVQMAIGCSEQGESEQAMALARAALALVNAHELDERLPRVLSLMGGLHGRMGEWAEGEALLLRALSLARDGHDADQEVVTLNALVMHLLHACEDHRAHDRARSAAAASARLLQHARRALVLSNEEPQPFRRVVLRSNAAAALLDAGLADEAARLLNALVPQADEAGYVAAAFRARLRLARACLALGQVDEAAQHVVQLQRALAQPGHPADDGELRPLMAAVASARAAATGVQAAPVIQPSTGST